MRSPNRFPRLALVVLASLAALTARSSADDDDHKPKHHQLVSIPGEDRFTPFAMTIHVGDTVDWINDDTDDHTVVSDDAVNTAGPAGINVLITGTDKNGGQPGPPFSITFHDAGQWVYFCRFHSVPDTFHQPNSPGPDGGIQDTKDPSKCDPAGTDTCNFGTPMMGVITILPRHHDEDVSALPPR
jgi:plastocyanin